MQEAPIQPNPDPDHDDQFDHPNYPEADESAGPLKNRYKNASSDSTSS